MNTSWWWFRAPPWNQDFCAHDLTVNRYSKPSETGTPFTTRTVVVHDVHLPQMEVDQSWMTLRDRMVEPCPGA